MISLDRAPGSTGTVEEEAGDILVKLRIFILVRNTVLGVIKICGLRCS